MTRRSDRAYDVAFYVPWIGALLLQKDGKSTGGAETQVFLLARALAERGLRVCLLAFDIPGEQIPRHVDGVDVIVRPPYKSKQRLLGRVREVLNIRAALWSVDAATYVTRAAGPHVGLVALFAKLRRRRFVYASASPIDFEGERVAPKRRDQFLLRIGFRVADALVVQTREQERSCLDRVGRRPVVIPSIAEDADVAGGVGDAILWIGRLVSYKQPLVFVELARALPQIEFTMVAAEVPFAPGASDLTETVRAADAELPNLHVLQPLPRQHLMDAVGRAVAVVSTSTFEGMPNVFLEAWARGVPTVAYEYDPDGVVEQNGLGAFVHGSFEQLVDVVRAFWEKRAEPTLAEHVRAYVARVHGAEGVAARWHDVVAPASAASTRALVEVA